MSYKYRNVKYEEKNLIYWVFILNKIDIFLIKEVVIERLFKNLYMIRYK